MDNRTIARKLNDYATYLEGEESNVYRVRAYRRAAQTVLAQERPLKEVVEQEGRAGLEALPGIGDSLGYTIEGLVRTGEFRTFRPEGGHIDPERLLTSLPGVGPHLAHQLHEKLGITTLEDLERAAHDMLRLRRRVCVAQPVTRYVQVSGEEQARSVTYYEMKMVEQMEEHALEKVRACDTDGNPVDSARLRKMLRKEMAVLVSADGREVHSFHLQLVKKDALILMVPPGPPAVATTP
jgi:DNA polymerase/3'-5' exonuclease PolX